MEICLFFLLHQKIAHSRIQEEFSALVTRGNNHRDVLEMYYHDETIHHIALMETKSDTEVVITTKTGELIISSTNKIEKMNHLFMQEKEDVPREGIVIENRWNSEPYIATMTSFETNETSGYVYMFKETSKIRQLIYQLNKHFWIAGISTVIVTAIIILILSRIITRPLIRMKEATKKLSKGNFSIQLENSSNDELGELSNSIQRLANELSHLKTERNEFLASISHELRTPLTYIKGYADVAKRKQISQIERMNYLTIITEEATKLSMLVAQLFELAQLDNNNFTIEKESISVYDMMNKLAKKVLPAFQQSGVALKIHCPRHIHLLADPIRFEQIIMNLLDNARKYSLSGTTTIVEVTEQQSEIVITIGDSGKGIPSEDLPFIFERFYRVDKSRSRKFGGTGLGLAIVKELVEAHSWDIFVTSEINSGTTFTIMARGES